MAERSIRRGRVTDQLEAIDEVIEQLRRMPAPDPAVAVLTAPAVDDGFDDELALVLLEAAA